MSDNYQMNYTAWRKYFNLFIELYSDKKVNNSIIYEMSELLLKTSVSYSSILDQKTTHKELKDLLMKLISEKKEVIKDIKHKKN